LENKNEDQKEWILDYKKNPYFHAGYTFEDLDCERIERDYEMKKMVII
jgi:hypothetical protein